MKSYAAFGAVLLALAGLWYVGGGSAVPAQTAAAAEQPHVSAPLTHNNLTVYFVHGPDTVVDTHKVATLQEALEAGWAVVNETGNVNTLTVQNNSDDYELFIQEGDMIKGGKQDRVFAVDMLVPPKSGVIPFPAHCVESGRWTARGSESTAKFSKSDNFAVGKGLRYANATQQQGEVWKNVKENQEKLSATLKTKVNAQESESSFQLALENKDLLAKVADFEEALREAGASRKNVIGVVFYVNGQVTGAEVYGSNALFQKAWPKLLKSQAADAIQEKTDKTLPPNPSVQEVERFLAMAGKSDSVKPTRNRDGHDMDLTNEDPGLQTNLEAALPEIQRVDQQTQQTVDRSANLNGRSGSTRSRLLNAGGAQAGQTANPNEEVQQLGGLQQSMDNVQAPISVVTATGGRLNVQRVEDKAGLCSESRDPSRQNALIHKSYIKK
ncbi:MAG: hypothetical protein K8U57_22385 [Planctomycetes bacterium]|nr:hypothetical protein [Planctomycetota bacterium]